MSRGLYTYRIPVLLAAMFCTCGAGTAAALGLQRPAVPAVHPAASEPAPPVIDVAATRIAPTPTPRKPQRRVSVPAVHVAHRTAPTWPAHRSPRHAAPAMPTGPTDWLALNAAIARIPTYVPGRSIWLVSDRYGHWGTADWYHDMLYISPRVPADRLYDVAAHEWSHELSVLDYAGDVDAAVAAMNRAFGASGSTGLVGAERAADCMAILQGATWTHYTPCTSSSWRRLAARLLHGQRL